LMLKFTLKNRFWLPGWAKLTSLNSRIGTVRSRDEELKVPTIGRDYNKNVSPPTMNDVFLSVGR